MPQIVTKVTETFLSRYFPLVSGVWDIVKRDPRYVSPDPCCPIVGSAQILAACRKIS